MAGKSKKKPPQEKLDDDSAALDAVMRVIEAGGNRDDADAAWEQAIAAAKKKPTPPAGPTIVPDVPDVDVQLPRHLQGRVASATHIREWKLMYEILKETRATIEAARPDSSPAEIDELLNAIGNTSKLRRAAQERYQAEVQRAKDLAKAHRKGKGGGKVAIHTELRELLAQNDTATESDIWKMVPDLECVVEVIEDPVEDDPRCSEFLGNSKRRCAPTDHVHYKQNGRPSTIGRRTIQDLLHELKPARPR